MYTFTRRSCIRGGLATLTFVAARAGNHVYAHPPRPGEALDPEADNSRRIVPPPPAGYWGAYRGISGPGEPVTSAAMRGGWTSGLPDVSCKGPVTPAYPIVPWGMRSSGTAVDAGLLPAIRPLWHVHIRDTIICRGGDGFYYMTGSTGDNIWAFNDGVELWRSADLKNWDYLGLVWSIDRDGSWEKNWTMRKGVYFRAIWAPEIHFLAGNYFICTSISGVGIGILRSTSGKATGPYEHVISRDLPIKGSIDSTLFEDDDGRIYLTYGSADALREIRPDFSGFAGDWVPFTHEGAAESHWLGYEGATMFKRGGLYYLGAVHKFDRRYSFAFAVSEKIHGPYRMWHEGVPCGGGGNIFKDGQGRWWQTFFGNDNAAPFREMPGLVRIDFTSEGKIIPHKDQPFTR